MPTALEPTGVRVTPVAGTESTRRLEPQASRGQALVIAGYLGDALPPMLHDALLEPVSGPSGWQLTSREGRFRFQARSVEQIESLPGLFQPLLARHELRPGERRIARVLLALLRLPGGAWLLRSWQSRRSQGPSR